MEPSTSKTGMALGFWNKAVRCHNNPNMKLKLTIEIISLENNFNYSPCMQMQEVYDACRKARKLHQKSKDSATSLRKEHLSDLALSYSSMGMHDIAKIIKKHKIS